MYVYILGIPRSGALKRGDKSKRDKPCLGVCEAMCNVFKSKAQFESFFYVLHVQFTFAHSVQCLSCLGHPSNVRPNGRGGTHSILADADTHRVLGAHTYLLTIRAICDEVNAGLMTGHGAHAFNQTHTTNSTNHPDTIRSRTDQLPQPRSPRWEHFE